MKPVFITVEGGEGAGKSTQMERLRAWLEEHGHRVTVTRQPGGTRLAERLRSVLLDTDHAGMNPTAELLLLFADRAQFMSEVVRPSLADGISVLCDRFTDSTYAYQGGGRGVPDERIALLENLVHGDLQPNLTLLLDLSVPVGLERVRARGDADRFETEDEPFFERVRAAYLARAQRFPERIEVVDAQGEEDEVWSLIAGILMRRFGT